MRIHQVRLAGFRGAPKQLVVDFSNSEDSPPASLLLIGDNGTGKSSIIDAIEFGVQGRGIRLPEVSISRSISRLRNIVSTENDTAVDITLENGNIFSRSLTVDDSSRYGSEPTGPIPPFLESGFILRRDDLITFLRAGSRQRASVFAAFTRGLLERDNPRSTESAERLRDLQQQYDSLLSAQERRAARLAGLLNLKIDGFPAVEEKRLDSILVEHGWVRKAIERKRKGRLTERERIVFAAISDVRNGITPVRAVREKLLTASRTESLIRVTSLLAEVSNTLTESLKQVSPTAHPILEVQADIGNLDKPQVALHVTLASGQTLPAEDYFSEANLDLLALLLFLALMEKATEYGQPKVLVLDDVLQSVDSVIRLHVAEYLLRRFAKWQLIMTFHDRLWYEEFRALCTIHGHRVVERQIIGWSHDEGPRLIQMGRDASDSLRAAMELANPQLLCGQAGLLVETMADWLSKNLGTSVTRRHGDKYTLGDTWPGVQKTLCAYEIAEVVRTVGESSFLRNLSGAHYNEWASSISLAEARTFAERTLSVWEAVWCQNCRSVIRRIDSSSIFISCRCGQLVIYKLGSHPVEDSP